MKLFILLSLMISSQMGSAKTVNSRQVMNESLKSFIRLIPFASDEMKFTDPKNEQQIVTYLKNIQKAFEDAGHISKLDTPGFRPSVRVIQSHLQETIDAFGHNNKLFARNRVRALGGVCMSCHTQLDSLPRSRFSKELSQIKREQFADRFEFAEFLFLIRQFSDARKNYERFIDEELFKEKAIKEKVAFQGPSSKKIDEGVRRILAVLLKIEGNRDGALEFIDGMLEKESLNDALRIQLNGWKREVLEISKRVTGPTKPADVKNFVNNNLKDKGLSHMKLLWASGLLSQYLKNNSDNEVTPLILLWLARADRELNFSFYYSLAEVYLKECVETFSNNPYAKECVEEYVEYVRFSFTGSGGAKIPPEELKEIARLKALVK